MIRWRRAAALWDALERPWGCCKAAAALPAGWAATRASRVTPLTPSDTCQAYENDEDGYVDAEYMPINKKKLP